MRCEGLWAPVARALAVGCVLLAAPASGAARELNGFSLADASIDAELVRAGAKRDGIRAIDAPSFASPSATRVVEGNTPVIGIEIDGDARAYPVQLLEYHQIVNDVVGGVPVAVTYDPLAGTPLTYRAKVDGERLRFGVSGLVYESNFLLFDRETESLWSQLLGRAVVGPKKGKRLERVRTRQEAFGVWLQRHPDTKVLERPFPKKIDYRYSPFSDYWISENVPFPVSTRDERFHPKESVLGVEADGETRAYLGSIVTAAGGRIVDEVAGHKVRIAYEIDSSAFSYDVPEDVRVTEAYWFAWKTFHPDTGVWTPEGAAAGASEAEGDEP